MVGDSARSCTSTAAAALFSYPPNYAPGTREYRCTSQEARGSSDKVWHPVAEPPPGMLSGSSDRSADDRSTA